MAQTELVDIRVVLGERRSKMACNAGVWFETPRDCVGDMKAGSAWRVGQE